MKMVQIQSSITIRVTCGLQNKDVTNPDAHVPDRLKVNPEWPKHQVLIRKGIKKYPAEIKTWPSVQALAKDKVLTIADLGDIETSELDDEERKNAQIIEEAKNEFKLTLDNEQHKGGDKGESKPEEKSTSVEKGKKTLTLNDLAGGDK